MKKLAIIPSLTTQNLLDPRLRGDDNLKIRTHHVIPAQAGIQEVIFVLVGIITKKLSRILLILLCVSCASYKPIFDQNEKYLSTNEEQRQSDADSCKKEASEYLDKLKAERAAREAGRKAIIGGVIGTAIGAISRKNLKSTLTGGVIGIGVGAIAGALSVAGEDKVKPDVIKQRYIMNCLAKKGYLVIGWY